MSVHSNNSTKPAKITATIIMLWTILVGKAMSNRDGDEEIEKLFKVSANKNISMPPSTILSETDEFKLENYRKKEKQYIFTKNLSKEKTEIIATEIAKNINYSPHSCTQTCFYTEVEENGETKREYALSSDITAEDKKKILIVPNKNLKQRILNRIEETKKQVEDPRETERIKSAIKLMERILNRMVYQLYVDDWIADTNKNTKYIRRKLEKKGLENTIAYALFHKEAIHRKQEDNTELFNKYNTNALRIKEIAENYRLVKRTDEYIIEEIDKVSSNKMEKVCLKELNRFIKKIEKIEKTHNDKTVEDLKKYFIKEAIKYANILTNGELDCHMHINMEKMKNEIKKEVEEKEARDKLVEAMDKCSVCLNGEISVKNLRKKIEEDEEFSVEYKRIKLNPSISKKKPENAEENLVANANKMLSRIICSGKIQININTEDVEKKAIQCNRSIVKLLVWAIKRYNRFEESEKEIRKCIRITNREIINECKNCRQMEYAEYKYMITLQQIVEKRVLKIMNILEKHDTNLQRQASTKENKQIISILADISVEHYGPNEQETHDYIQRCIKSILSSIEEDLSVRKYSITDKIIQEKKQNIVDLVFKTVDIPRNKEDVFEIEDRAREIVERIVDFLLSNTINRTKNCIYENEIEEVKKEIILEEEYIRGQNLANSLNSVFKFVEKYGSISKLQDSSSYVNANGYILPAKCMDLMKNAFSKGKKEIAKWALCDITLNKLDTLLAIFIELNEICLSKTILKLYDELWLSPAFLFIDIPNISMPKEKSKAYIYYKFNSNRTILSKKCIKLTNKNLKSFRNARTVKDIDNIEEIK